MRDPPLRIRHDILTHRLILRWMSWTGHPAIAVLQEDLAERRRTGRYAARLPPLLHCLEDMPVQPEEVSSYELPPSYETSPLDMMNLPKITTIFPPPSTTDNETRNPSEAFQLLTESAWREKYIMATDGSKCEADGTVGAAFVDLQTTPVYSKKFKLHPLTTVYEAETRAMAEATKYLLDRPHVKDTVILTDNQALLKAMATTYPPISESPVMLYFRQCSSLTCSEPRRAS